MSYYKMTTILGHKDGYQELTAPLRTTERYLQIEANRPFVYVKTLSGHWDQQKALAFARKRGCIGPVELSYSTADLSGKGYGGVDKTVTVE